MLRGLAGRIPIGMLALGFATAAAPAWSGIVSITSDTRSIVFEPNSFCEFNCPAPMSASGPGVDGTFNQQYGDGSFPGGQTSQNTTVSANGMSMVGSGSSLTWLQRPSINNGFGASQFEVDFTLTQAASFTFTGNVTASGGSSELELLDLTNPAGADYQLAGTPNPNSISVSGTLAPGQYVLSANAATLAGSISTGGGPVSEQGGFSFDLELSPSSVPPVPLPAAACLLLSGLGGLGALLSRRDRERCVASPRI
jgi:hypothetical protein